MPNGTQFGFEPGGEFAPAFEAAQRRLRGGAARRRADLARSTRRVRTSGVSLLPRQTLEAGEAEAEAGLVGEFGLRQATENIEDRRAQEAFQRRLTTMRLGGKLEGDLQRSLARRGFQRDVLRGGIGAGLGIIGGIVNRGG